MKKILLPLAAFLFVGCGAGVPVGDSSGSSVDPTVESTVVPDQQSYSAQASLESEDTQTPAQSAASIISSPSLTKLDSTRKLIRTADVRFRTSSVEKATIGIENVVLAQGGFVSTSQIESSEDMLKSVDINQDESVEAVSYTVTNNMTFCVPSSKMDTTLKAIAKYVDFLNYRRLYARDVTLDIISEQLKAKRNNQYVGQVASGSANTKVADKILTHRENADQAMLSRYALASQIYYCTINVSIYQSPKISYNTVARFSSDKFEPSFSYEFGQAISLSWSIVVGLFLILVRLSGLIVVGLGIFFGVRYWIRYSKSKKS